MDRYTQRRSRPPLLSRSAVCRGGTRGGSACGRRDAAGVGEQAPADPSAGARGRFRPDLRSEPCVGIRGKERVSAGRRSGDGGGGGGCSSSDLSWSGGGRDPLSTGWFRTGPSGNGEHQEQASRVATRHGLCCPGLSQAGVPDPDSPATAASGMVDRRRDQLQLRVRAHPARPRVDAAMRPGMAASTGPGAGQAGKTVPGSGHAVCRSVACARGHARHRTTDVAGWRKLTCTGRAEATGGQMSGPARGRRVLGAGKQ
jgi:hypothetical protein